MEQMYLPYSKSQNVFLLDVVSVYRPAEDLSREAKSSTDVNHNSSTAVMTPSSHGPGKTSAQAVTSSSPASSSNSVLSNFLYGMPMSSKPHPDGQLDFKPMSLLNLGKDRLANWTAGTDKISTSIKDCGNNGEMWFFGITELTENTCCCETAAEHWLFLRNYWVNLQKIPFVDRGKIQDWHNIHNNDHNDNEK